MEKFATIINDKLISIREAQEIVNGEIEFSTELEGVEVGMIFIDGSWQQDPEEIKQLRISKLKEIISNKKLLDMDCTEEQTELRGLLGL